MKLAERLLKIWQPGDFKQIFEKFSNKKEFMVKKGTVLFNEGQPLDRIFFIKSGFVKLYRLSEEGRESIIYLYGAGQILGIRALTSEDECARHFAEAITDLEVVSITRGEYLEAVAENPEYLLDLLHVFIDRLNYTEKKLTGFILTDTVARVAFFLSDCATRFGISKKDTVELPIELTHQRIAEFVGSFRETVTLAVQKLEQMGIINIKKSKVAILDLKKLHKLAGL